MKFRSRGFASAGMALRAALLVGLWACDVEIKDGVYTCNVSADCPAGLHCHPAARRCTRELFDVTGRGEPAVDAGGAGTRTNVQQGAAESARTDAAISEQESSRADGGSVDAAAPDASIGGSPASEADSGKTPTAGAPAEAGSGASTAGADAETSSADRPTAGTTSEAGSGGVTSTTGTAAEAGSGAPDAPSVPTGDCPADTYCYGFEAGPLDPSGALWPSPSDGSGGLPPHDELTIAPYPAASSNMVLVSRPSSMDGWPKATVGFSGPRAPFSQLLVSFDYVAGDQLVTPNPRVILFRFVGMPARNGDSVNVGLLNDDVMLEVQMNGPDPLTAIGRATGPGVLTHVVSTFVLGPDACTVTVSYGDLPPRAAAFPCDVEKWQIELGLDLLETPPESYDDRYVGYFDNLRVSATP